MYKLNFSDPLKFVITNKKAPQARHKRKPPKTNFMVLNCAPTVSYLQHQSYYDWQTSSLLHNLPHKNEFFFFVLLLFPKEQFLRFIPANNRVELKEKKMSTEEKRKSFFFFGDKKKTFILFFMTLI